MAKIWRNRIWAGDKTYEECPTKYKADVLVWMRSDVVSNLHTAEEFEEKTGIPYAGESEAV